MRMPLPVTTFNLANNVARHFAYIHQNASRAESGQEMDVIVVSMWPPVVDGC
jgi:hypothetical protein